MVNTKILPLKIAKIIGVAVILSLAFLASFQNIIFPFAIPIAIAMLCLGIKSYIVAPIYFLTSLLNGVTESNLIINGYSAIIILFVGLFYLKENSNIKWWQGCIYVVLCEVAFLYYNAYIGDLYLNSGLTVAVALLTFICVKHIFTSFKKHPLMFKITTDEAMCFCFLIMVLSSGIANIQCAYFSPYHLIGFLLILLFTYTFNKNQTILFSLVYGLGYTINTLDVGYVAIFASVALAIVSFKSEYKAYSIFAGIITDVLFGMYLNTGINYNLTSIAECIVASVIFVSVPSRFLQYFSGYFLSNQKNFSVKNIMINDKLTLQNKLLELSNVFNEMDIVFRKMIKGVLPISDAKEMLVKETCQKVCTDCKNRTKCFRTNQNVQNIYYDLITIAFEKGKVTLLDVPPNMASFCAKTSQILIVINQLINEYKQYATMITNLDSSRLLIADQLNGVARIMKDLSTKIDEEILFDTSKEKIIIDELSLNNIVCNDVIVYTKDNYTTNVNLLIRNQDVKNPSIKSIVSKVCGNLLEIKEITASEISGWSMVNLSTMMQYDIMFGYASTCKNGETISGDKYSIVRLSNSKFLMAICDGMGSGETASATSELAISLVENFYKAGFDNDIILSSINKLLAVNKNENFTALDLCVVDLKNCFADFIKVGAPIGLIKHKDTITQLKGGALPIGILEEIKPICYKTVLNDKDLIILCSDGITEAFSTNENFATFVNNIDTLHPQQLADLILEKAISLNLGVANDDMTVVVGRVFQKIA